jgi:glycosyltransferase involved in cell wall biosynthesis
LEDERFRYLPGSTAGTPATPRNRAILEGNGPYVAFLDDDDLWLPEKLERQIGFMKSHPSCVLLGCNAFLWAGTGAWNPSLPLYFRKAPFGRVAYKALVRDNCFINSSVIVRRDVLQKSGLLNEALLPPIGEDYDLWLRIGVLGEAWLMPEPLVVYRVWPSSSIGSRSTSDRRRNYETKARIYSSALSGTGDIPSPLSYPENAEFAAACRYERDFYLAGPRCGGRLMYLIKVAIKKYFLACT